MTNGENERYFRLSSAPTSLRVWLWYRPPTLSKSTNSTS